MSVAADFDCNASPLRTLHSHFDAAYDNAAVFASIALQQLFSCRLERTRLRGFAAHEA
jgi:hypothetical protein